MIDWTVKLGDLIQIGFIIGGAFGLYFNIRGSVKELKLTMGFVQKSFEDKTEAQNEKIDRQAEEISKLGNLVVLVGRYEERMSALQEDVKELRHGRGFVIDKTIQLGGAG